MGSQLASLDQAPGGRTAAYCLSLSFAHLLNLFKLGWFHIMSPCLPVPIPNSPMLVLKKKVLCSDPSWFGLFWVVLLLVATFFCISRKNWRAEV